MGVGFHELHSAGNPDFDLLINIFLRDRRVYLTGVSFEKMCGYLCALGGMGYADDRLKRSITML